MQTSFFLKNEIHYNVNCLVVNIWELYYSGKTITVHHFFISHISCKSCKSCKKIIYCLTFSREMKSARNCKVYSLLYCASVTHHSASECLFLLSEVLYVICIFILFKLKSTDDINFSNVWLLTNQIKFFLQFKNLHS